MDLTGDPGMKAPEIEENKLDETQEDQEYQTSKTVEGLD